jgi:hypothetical protein
MTIEYTNPGAVAFCKLEEAMYPRPDWHTVGLVYNFCSGFDQASGALASLDVLLDPNYGQAPAEKPTEYTV